jgi:putative pyruvate formate lyase activating enzyme
MPSPLNRRVSRSEYGELVDYALTLGVKNAFIQSEGSADESFIPPFDLEGVL